MFSNLAKISQPKMATSKINNFLNAYTKLNNPDNANANNKRQQRCSSNGGLHYVCFFFFLNLFIVYYFVAIYNSNGTTNSADRYYFSSPSTKHRRRQLRIAQISALSETVPPKNYGSIERIAHYLTEELVRRGHQVTLFAASGSQSSAKLIEMGPPFRKSDLNDPTVTGSYRKMFDQVGQMADQFDILHFQTDMQLRMKMDFKESNRTKILLTMHWEMDIYPELNDKYKDLRVVSVSNDQRRHAVGQPNFIGTVYHGIPRDLLKFVEKAATAAGKEPYLVFLGRIDQTKQPDWAIQIAVKAGIRLKMAAKVDDYQKGYWQNVIKPMIDQHRDLVEFLGEVDDRGKSDLLGNALAFLFPINWPEPFGMVLIESMACGTPVIARRKGPVEEIVEEGVSGLLFDTIEQAVEAVRKVGQIPRLGVRRAFERRFTAEKMADGYEQLYYNMTQKHMTNE